MIKTACGEHLSEYSGNDTRKPTYDQLSALCAQMAATLKFYRDGWQPTSGAYGTKFSVSPDLLNDYGHRAQLALTAYRTLSPDPVWQRVPEGWKIERKHGRIVISHPDHGGTVCGMEPENIPDCLLEAFCADLLRARGED